MAYVDRVKPEDYNAILVAFGQIGGPIFARVAAIIDKQRAAAGNPKRIAYVTLRKAWEKGWDEQVGGAAAPAIKTLFPTAKSVSYSHDEATPDKGVSERPGAAYEAALTQRVEPPNTLRHEEHIKQEESVIKSESYARELTVSDPMKRLAGEVEKGRVPALLNEMAILAAVRRNVLGLQDVAGTLIATLAGRKDVLVRMVNDLAFHDVATLRTLRETLRELGAFMKDLQLTFKTAQESQRLLEGLPQSIREERRAGAGGGDEELEARALVRLAGMLRTSRDSDHDYRGEETGNVQDVEFVEGTAENAVSTGEDAAKETAATTQVGEVVDQTNG